MTFDADIEILTIRAKAGDSASQSQLGQRLFQAGRVIEAAPWIEKAAISGELLAQNLFGVMCLNGLAVPLDFVKAAQLLSQSAERGLKEASYTLAGLYANGFGVTANQQAAWRYLMQACRAGHAPAIRVAGLLYSLTQPDNSTGTDLLRLAAGQGDALAQAALASLLLMKGSGGGLKKEAGYWAARAFNGGVHSVRTLVSVLPVAANQPPLPAEPNWEELQPVIPKVHQPIRNRVLVPGIVYEAENVLPQLGCDYLINLSAPRLRPSLVVDPNTGQQVQNPVRSSHSMYFPPSMYDCVVAYVRSFMAAFAQLPADNAEPLSMLRYTPGQQYKPHQDYFVGTTATDEHTERQGGQRAVTVFAYLNDVEAGGETEFPEFNLKIHPGYGKAVKFMNLDSDGVPNPKTLHAGCPVIRGEKWLATFWFRQRPFAWTV
jgi:prolyl 4-hydroxylase